MKGKKLAAGTIAIVTAASVIVTTILSNGVESTYAQESFSGLAEIVDGKEYKILEIVPDMSEAKLGLLVSGKESYYDPQTGHYGSLEEVLSGMGTRAERVAYIESVCSKYRDIVSESKDNVLTFTPYQESYVPVEDYKHLMLNSERILDKDSSDLDGYYMIDLGENATSGQYELDAKFIVAGDGTDPSALYSQKISYYDFGSKKKYYNVEFLLTDTVADGMGAYQPLDGAPITQEMWDGMAPGELFYMLSSDGASFTLCQKSLPEETTGLTTDGNGTEAESGATDETVDDGLPKVTEYLSDRFYMVYFKYVAPENINTAANSYYYEPYSVTFAVDDSGNPAGNYGAVLDAAQPYVEDSVNGHFVKDVDNMYYMKSGTGGRYELVKAGEDEVLTAAQKLQYDVEVDSIYYTGGISSNDTLKNSVFNQSGLLDEADATLNIAVDAVLPRNVTVEMANEYDLIYLSNSFLYNLKSDPASYAADNDLTGNVANVIYSLVIDSTVYKPVIVDASILAEGGVSADTNIYKLARLLSSESMVDNTASYNNDTWTVTYGTSYADANSDGYFVNGNVFSVPGDGTKLTLDGRIGNHTFSFLDDFATPFIEEKEAGRSEYENFSADTETAFQTAATALGFGEIAGCISDENFIRDSENTSKTLNKDKYKFFDLSISRAICVEYIICYVSKRETNEVGTIQILDIEPCTVSSVSKTTIETDIKNLLGITDTGIKVTFTHMTSAELISKVEDLCKYDLIYMGLYTDSMNLAKSKRYYLNSDTKKEYPLASVSGLDSSDYTSEYVEGTQYNEKSMDGLIYTSIGDIRKAKSFAGLLDTDYNLYDGVYSHFYKNADGIWVNWYGASDYNYSTTRYSGNDLTEEKLSDLLDYVKSAAPVILADDFLTTVPQADGTYKRVVNDKKTLYTAKKKDGTYSLEASSSTINGTIDNCSRMYELINDIAVATTYKNVKTYSEWQGNQSLLNRYITLGKPKLDVIESAKVDGEEYIKTDGDNVVINFRVKAYGSVQTDASFTVDLFVDFNADGRYSKTTEKLDVYSYNIYLIDTKKDLKQKINPVTKTVDGKETTYYSLPALNGKTDNQYYSLEYAVQKSYLGVYPVKLVVEQQDNEYRYSYWEGYYYHEKTAVSTSEGTTKEVVKVIQILPDSLYDDSKTMFDMDLTGSYATGSETKNTKYAALFADKYKNHDADTYYNYSDVKTSLSGTYTEHNWNNSNEMRWNMLIDTFKHSSFYTYAFDTGASGNKLGGYELQIDSVFASSLVDYFTKKNADSTYTFDDAGYQEFLDYYDMLILGFGDAGNYFSSVTEDTKNKMQNLEDHYYTGIHNFIQSGKSVLFTHDTTSYESPDWISGDTPPSWKTGHLSDLLAGDVGFDRYGVYDNDDSLLSLALSAGIDNITKNGTRTFTISQYPSLATAKRLGLLAQYDKSLTAGSAEDTISEATLFDIIVTESDEKHENKDVAYQPNTNRTVLTYEVQGRSTICINRQGDKTIYPMTNFASKLNGKTVTTNWGEGRTYQAELLNVGQILIYPYNVYDQIKNNDNLLNVAETHYQYFQIDMNADEDLDGESDITVWLSLTDKGNSYNYIEYDVAERDARNNYYIYTKGNITYSGVGHASINSDKYVAETQLYINTMIASYQATVQKPEVSIKESPDSGSPDKDTIYISMDSSINVDSNGIGTVVDSAESLDNDKITTGSYQTKTGSDGKQYWKADVTKKDGKNDVSTYEEAYLYIQDTNVTRGTVKQIKLTYYLMLDSKDDVPDESLKDLVVNLNEGKSGLDSEWAIPLNLETYSLTYDEDGNEVPQTFDEQSEEIVSGKYYRVDIPYYVLAAAKKRAEVRCYVTTTISKKNTLTGVTTKISESTSYDSVYLQRISLFDLQ